jgi:hypothetical protein
VRLLLVEWPSGSALAKAPVGQKIPLRVLGHATSVNGTYKIGSNVSLPKGIHNLEILARSSTARGAFGFPRKIVRRGRSLVAVAVNGSASTGPVTANIHMMALPKSAQSPSRHPSNPYCLPGAIKHAELGKRLVTVGALYSEEGQGTTQETYSAGSNTTLGIGLSVSGDIGSVSFGGTFTQTSSGSEPFPVLTNKSVLEQTPYRFGTYIGCGLSQVVAEAWATGQNKVFVQPPDFPFKNCGGNIGNGQSFTRKSGTAGTFKAGVNLKKVIGINLSAQSGYNTQVNIQYVAGPTGGFMCGTDNLPNDASFDVLSPCNGTVCVPGSSGTGSVRADRPRTASAPGRVQARRTRSSR